MLQAKFNGNIKYLDPEKKIFEGCLYMGEAAGHLTQISGTNVHFPYLGCFSIANSRWTPEHKDRRWGIDIQ